MAKAPDAFRTISEVAEWLETPAHVLRFWESKFSQVKPVKRAGGRRYYRPEDAALLAGIKTLLHDQGLTIKGVQKMLREQGVKHVCGLGERIGVPGEKSGDVIDGTATEITDARQATGARAAPSESPQTRTDDESDIEPDIEPDKVSARDAGPSVGETDAGPAAIPLPTKGPAVSINLRPAAAKETATAEPAAEVVPFPATGSAGTSGAAAAPQPEISAAEPETPRTRRPVRIPVLPTNPGAFAHPGPLSAILKAHPERLAKHAARLAPIAARLSAQRRAMHTDSR